MRKFKDYKKSVSLANVDEDLMTSDVPKRRKRTSEFIGKAKETKKIEPFISLIKKNELKKRHKKNFH